MICVWSAYREACPWPTMPLIIFTVELRPFSLSWNLDISLTESNRPPTSELLFSITLFCGRNIYFLCVPRLGAQRWENICNQEALQRTILR